MKKKSLVFIVTGILVVGSVTGFTYAKVSENKGLYLDNQKSVVKQDQKMDDMADIMKENGYEDVAGFMENGDYEAMDEFMNNLTDEDYEKMIEIMKENGYGGMARMMERMDKDQMIQMHNSMGGAKGCHADDQGDNKGI